MGERTTRAAVAALVLWAAAPAFASDLGLGHVTARRGQSVTVPVVYRQTRGPVAVAVSTDITFDTTALSHPQCALGAALSSSGPAAKLVICSEPAPGVLRLAVLGLNAAPIASGEIATVSFDVAATARPRPSVLRHKPGAADAQGTDFRLTHRNGAIRIR